MDTVATAITDLVLSAQPLPRLVNVTHPHLVQWREIIENISVALHGKPLPIVPFDEWLRTLTEVSLQAKPEDLTRIVSTFFCGNEWCH